MTEFAGELADENGEPETVEAVIEVGLRVRVNPNTDAQGVGIVVDDFGESAGYAVEIGDNHIADAARRWAVLLDSGTLVFANSDQLVAV